MKIKTLEEANIIYEALVSFREGEFDFYMNTTDLGAQAKANRRLMIIDTLIGGPSQ
jgi:hypothetical protein